MLDIDSFIQQESVRASEFQKEVVAVYTQIVCEPNDQGLLWKQWGCVFTQYGYVMNCFGRLDLLSSLWRGVADSNGDRISEFLVAYLDRDVDTCRVAVKLWRHKLMHLNAPRLLRDNAGKSFSWLLHWDSQLPVEWHFTLTQNGADVQFRMGVMYLVQDVIKIQDAYFAELKNSLELRQNFERSMIAQTKTDLLK